MGKQIQDEFTDLDKARGGSLSRQRIHALRKRKLGLCIICTEPAAIAGRCAKHHADKLRRQRKAQ